MSPFSPLKIAKVTFVLAQPAFALTAFALNPLPASQITAVTIYQGNASVTRQLPISGEGEQQVVFGCLSGNLEQNSLQLTAPDGVNIGEINVQTLSGEQAKLCQQQGNPNFTNTQNQLAVINAKLKANETSMAYLDNFGKADQLNANQNIHNNVNQIRQSAEETALALASLRQQKAQLESQLASDMNASSAVAKQVTQVTAKVASRQNATVTLNYLVNGASWQPQYQASLDTQQRALNLQLQAIIAQTTGENWQNIPVTLSTAQPSYQTTVSAPRPIGLNLYDPRPSSKLKVQPLSMGYAPAPVVEDGIYSGASANINVEDTKKLEKEYSPNSRVPLPSYRPSVNNKNDIVEYALPQRVTIPSDGRRITTKLDSQTQPAEIWVRTVPSENLNAYWYAKAPFNQSANSGTSPNSRVWADGEMRLYRDGNYIGTGTFNADQLSSDGLGFGINKQVVVTSLNDSSQANQTRAVKKGVEIVEKAYQVKNNMARSIAVEVVSATPVAYNGQITVKNRYEPQPTTQAWQDKKGVIAWQFELNPQETRNVRQHHEISYPQDKSLNMTE